MTGEVFIPRLLLAILYEEDLIVGVGGDDTAGVALLDRRQLHPLTKGYRGRLYPVQGVALKGPISGRTTTIVKVHAIVEHGVEPGGDVEDTAVEIGEA
jgi:hypothetical protein